MTYLTSTTANAILCLCMCIGMSTSCSSGSASYLTRQHLASEPTLSFTLREIPSQRTHCVDIARYALDNCNKERRNRPYVFKLKPDAAAGSTAQKYPPPPPPPLPPWLESHCAGTCCAPRARCCADTGE